MGQDSIEEGLEETIEDLDVTGAVRPPANAGAATCVLSDRVGSSLFSSVTVVHLFSTNRARTSRFGCRLLSGGVHSAESGGALTMHVCSGPWRYDYNLESKSWVSTREDGHLLLDRLQDELKVISVITGTWLSLDRFTELMCIVLLQEVCDVEIEWP